MAKFTELVAVATEVPFKYSVTVVPFLTSATWNHDRSGIVELDSSTRVNPEEPPLPYPNPSLPLLLKSANTGTLSGVAPLVLQSANVEYPDKASELM